MVYYVTASRLKDGRVLLGKAKHASPFCEALAPASNIFVLSPDLATQFHSCRTCKDRYDHRRPSLTKLFRTIFDRAHVVKGEVSFRLTQEEWKYLQDSHKQILEDAGKFLEKNVEDSFG